jgi:hypothetical protein
LAQAVSGHPAAVYVREDKIVTAVDGWLGGLFHPEHLDRTIDDLYEASLEPGDVAARHAAREGLRHCDERLAKYRAALEAGADPSVVASWIAEVQAERTRHQTAVGRLDGQPRMTRTQIASVARELGELTRVLRQADPGDRAEVYAQLGLALTYDHTQRLVIAEASPKQACSSQCVRGPILTTAT